MHKRTLFLLIILMATAKWSVDHLSDTDTFWQIRLGMELLESGQMRTHVLHAWSVQGTWPAFDWLGQLILALGFLPLGFTSLALMKIALSMALAALVFATTSRASHGHGKATILASFAMLLLAAHNFSARPLLLGLCLFALEIFILQTVQDRGSIKGLWWLPPLFLIWGNIHGSWPIGLFPLAILGCERLFPRLTLSNVAAKTKKVSAREIFCLGNLKDVLFVGVIGLCCLLAQLCTPEPWAFLTRPFLWTSQGQENLMDEWAPATFASLSLWVLLAIACLFAFALRRACKTSKVSLPALVAFLILFVVALMKVRMVAYFAIFGCPILGELLSWVIRRKGFNSARQNRIFAAVVCAVLSIPTALSVIRASDKALEKIPVFLVQAIEEKGLSQTRGFNHFDWGGYLVFRNIPTFVDGRLEPFIQSGIFQQYLAMEETGDIQALETLGIRWALVRSDWPMAQKLNAAAEWTLWGTDDTSIPKAALFVRTEEVGQ